MQEVVQRIPQVYDIRDLKPLDFHCDAVDARGAEGKTEVRIFTGVPAHNLVSPDASDTALVERRVALIERATGLVHRVHGDLVVPIAGDRGAVIVEEFSMSVTPGDYTLAAQLWRRGTRRLGSRQWAFPVESYAGDSLMLSDIQVARSVILADSGKSGPFVRSGFQVTPSPGRMFYRGQPVFLYFEIYNLTRDRAGQTHYEVAYAVQDANRSPLLVRALSGLGRLLAGGETEGVVTVRYEQKGRRDQEGGYVEIDVSKSGLGEREVQVGVKDLNSGAEVSKSARFSVVEGRGLVVGP